uniref:PB1 domain-containing protein n=1 Tax=Nelumbo nucifera TaxID=4432 RepID=A0A822YGI6_NELNU|nr:TPA_asm: hypothetical protein HUJ06_009210 [Nelumbo nucifera]
MMQAEKVKLKIIYFKIPILPLLISNNQFSGNFPEEVGSLNNLVEFYAGDNQLNGPLPATLNLKLNRFNLSNNRLSGDIPPCVDFLGTISYSDSFDSSPRSNNVDSWDEPLPQVTGAKLRLMCSYDGHIVPRPHDKSLCYLGGDTRIAVVDRHSSLADLSAHLSRSLLNGSSFTLKYQLPNEDLDSLISITTDQDVENMMEGYDHTSASSIGSLLDDSVGF